jgi:hypothetical protein
MALQRLLRRDEPVQPAKAPSESHEEQLGFPSWVIPSITHFLAPFWGKTRTFNLSVPSRDFLREAGIHLRMTLDWSGDRQRTAQSLWAATYREPDRLVSLVDFALRNILIGYSFQDCDIAARELDRDLRNAGSAWQVRQIQDQTEYFLERRVDAATSAAVEAIRSEGTDVALHLSVAWEQAFGRSPQPGKAYDEAVKAVEAVAIPVVLPNDPKATLGKVIGEMRNDPMRWSCTFTEPTADGQSPVDVLIAMLGVLWTNDSERHAPVVLPITQEKAESAVHLAMTLVQLFRSGAIAKR